MKYRIGQISDMIIHYVGNKYREEGVNFSRNVTSFQEVESDLIATLEKSFITENVHNKARIVDISGFHITKQIEFRNMFASAPNLETIYASESFNPSFLSGDDNFYSNTK